MNFIFLLLFVYQIISTADSASPEVSKCEEAKKCEECMGISPECSWCFDSEYKDDRAESGRGYRCGTNETLLARGCPLEKIQSINSFEYKEPVNQASSQLLPNSKYVKVKPKDSFSTEFEFTSRENYPVDLYFLVDLSYTMRNHTATVSKMTNNIKNEMLKITSDVKLGFGAFVDKPIFPFVNPERKETPCVGSGVPIPECEPTFLYRHMLPLTDKFDQFQALTNNLIHSGNLDIPEGGFDALLQVAHCKDEIGWRKDARKIVVFATDGTFHLAGDGRLAGLIKPPPTTCQLKPIPSKYGKKVYLGWDSPDQTDYPSIGEVARVLEDKSISVIFATVNKLSKIYENIATFLPSTGVGILAENSENIVELLRDNYNKIASKVDITVNYDESVLDVKILTRCHSEQNFTEKSSCEGHPVGGKITYKVQVTPKSCFNKEEKVQLKLISLDETSEIFVRAYCECPLCDQITWSQANTAKCSNKGPLICGSCDCQPGFSGDFCQCSQELDEKESLRRCRNKDSSLICSGRGRCSCGACVCHDNRYKGDFCECDLGQCPRASDNSAVCGGLERGECQCDGKCRCKPGYNGTACDCLVSQDACFDGNKTRCSNRGMCDCGMCFCNVGWTGKLCNEPQGVGTPTCQMEGAKSCISCLVLKHMEIEEKQKDSANKSLKEMPIFQEAVEHCRESCEPTDFDYEKALVVRDKEQEDGSNLCFDYMPDTRCKLYFLYRYSDIISMHRKVSLKLLRLEDCSNPYELYYILAGVIAAIVLGGLLFLLIYKLVIVIEDKKEQAHYEKTQGHFGITMNPFYVAPSTTVTNPTYNRDKANGH